jgi:probable F420-dependent oxidoreductase
MVDYLDRLDAGGVPPTRRMLAALGPRALRLSAARTLGSHPYLVIPDHTREAREMLGPDVVIAPEQTVVVEADPDRARNIGRAFVSNPYLKLVNYTNNFRRYGYTDADLKGGGSDRLIDALVVRGSADSIAAGLHAQFEAGANHVGIQVLTADGENPMPGYQQLARVLL